MPQAGIQAWRSSNCIPAVSRNSVTRRVESANVASDTPSPTSLWSDSDSRRVSATTTAPTIGSTISSVSTCAKGGFTAAPVRPR